MFIHEAIAASRSVSSDKHALPNIRRRSWPYSIHDLEKGVSVRIHPSNSPNHCIILSGTTNGIRAGWQPTMDDLMADDWETCL